MNRFLRSKKESLAGFTLVELIVVITILVILGTIAFISLQGYAGSARDSVRIENLANLEKGLRILKITSGSYPMPEVSVNIVASGSLVGYQGFAKNQTAALARLSQWGTVDPLDSEIYTTYFVNATKSNMQIMGFLENGTQKTAYIPTVLAAAASDYSQRNPTVRGDGLGILIGTAGSALNQPVQESGTGVDIIHTQSVFTSVISDSKRVTGTGFALAKTNPRYNCQRISESGWRWSDGLYPINPQWEDFPVYCSAKFPDITFYDRIMDGDFEDATSDNWTGLPKTASSKLNGNYWLEIVGYKQFTANNYTFVNPLKTYKLEGSFRSAGSLASTLHFWFIEYDKDFNVISNQTVNAVVWSDSVLLQDAEPTDTSITFSNAGNTCSSWQGANYFSDYARIAFNTDDSGEYNDLPNRNFSSGSGGFSSIVDNGVSCTLHINGAIWKSYLAGTKIRMHSTGWTYNYVAASGINVPNVWTPYQWVVSGMAKYGVNDLKFKRGTQFVKILIIANYQQDNQRTLYIDDLKLAVQ